jgi:hypothetical protein
VIDAVAILFALALGFVLGLVAGARRALNLVLTGRAIRTSSARFARFMPSTMPTRSAADILAGRVRVVLGGTTHDLPVLPRGPSKRWLEQLDARFATLAASLDAAADTPEIMSLLVSETDALYDLLLSYDQSGVLPSRDEIDETATDAQILQAVLEVWRAVHPLVASVTEAASMTSGRSPAPPTSPPRPMAGDPTTSMPA